MAGSLHRRAPTMEDVAREAGVSRALVSLVMREQPNVSAERRQWVLEAAARLGYRPNAMARSLASRRTRTVGVILDDLRNPFFAEIAGGIEEYCYRVGYNVYLCNTADDANKELEYCQNLYRQRVAGVIICITGATPDGIHYLQARRMPTVLVDRSYPNVEADIIQCNHYDGAHLAIEYLVQLGHRNIGLIIGPKLHPPVRARLQACLDTFAQYDCILRPQCVHETRTYEHEEGYQGAACLFSAQPDLTAIFAFNDMLAIGALRYALEHGIRVPGDCSIIGFDNISLSSFVTPRLTTVAQPMAELGRTAAQLLLDRVADQQTSYTRIQQIFPPQLIIRESTGPVHSQF